MRPVLAFGVVVAGVLVPLGSSAAGSGPAAQSIRAGVYSGKVEMTIAVGRSHYPAALTGTWTVTVDRQGRLRGREELKGKVTFTSPDADGCTYSPRTWTIGARGTLGRSYSGEGTPGVVRGRWVLLDVWAGWYSAPSSYDRTCASITQTWPLNVVYTAGGDTVTPISGTLRLPLALFTGGGRTVTVRFTNLWKHAFVQRYTLASSPRST
jgi:hypothetical protein